jgi:3-oxoadipate enol-lactonase
MPMIDLNGETFHYRFDGPDTAPVLMLSNSLSSNLSMWDAQISMWSQHFRVLCYDARGHGQSVAPLRAYSMDELGQDALKLMDALGIAKAHWCGLSKGGMTGMWMATRAPHRLSKVVLANTAPLMGPPELWNGRIRNVRANGMAAIVEATMERWFTPGFLASGSPELAKVRAMIAATPDAGYMGCAAAIRDMDQREAIRGITLPVLVIAGLHDPATTHEVGRAIHESIAGSRFVSLDAAHVSNIEKPAEFGKAVLEFLRG